mmetsp:Transcript_3842/g.8815  ORF Transcript_3842/g.8815 Transcript_3842/m.8815 type:complete len:412 (+) Transcript_3842:504-1739(+)
MRLVHALVAEDAVNGKVPLGLEDAPPVLLVLLGQLVQHARGHRRRVRPQNVLLRLGQLPVVPVPDAAKAPDFVHFPHPLQVVLGDPPVAVRPIRPRQEEGVVRVARRVLLRLEERVKVPEARLHKAVCRHLLKAHPHEDFSELRAHLQQGVEVAAQGVRAEGVEVVLLEAEGGVLVVGEHLVGQVRGLLLLLERELGALARAVGHPLALLHELALLQQGQGLGLRLRVEGPLADGLEVAQGHVGRLLDLRHDGWLGLGGLLEPLDLLLLLGGREGVHALLVLRREREGLRAEAKKVLRLLERDPLVLHGLLEADARDRGAELVLELVHGEARLPGGAHAEEHLGLRGGARRDVALRLLGEAPRRVRVLLPGDQAVRLERAQDGPEGERGEAVRGDEGGGGVAVERATIGCI